MEPFLLKPACKTSIWGGTKLKKRFHKDYPGDIISESWELSVHPAGLSLADSGSFCGGLSCRTDQNPFRTGEICKRIFCFSVDDQMD